MAYEQILYEVRDRQAWVVLNRPEKRNALTPQMLKELHGAFDQADADPEVVAVVLTGAGDKAFCAGADLGGQGGGGMLEQHAGRSLFADLFLKMNRIGRPILCAANGHVMAGGLGLAAACDLIIARESANFSTPEIKRGLFPMMIMATIFRNVGRKAAMEMILLGETFGAQEAERIGLINRSVPDAEFDARVKETAGKLAGFSPAVLRLGREAIYKSQDMGFEEQLAYLKTMITLNTLCEDAMEGVMAWMQKRDPVWKGR